MDAAEVRYGELRSVPAEIVEVETALIVRGIRLIPDSRRAGQYVGGAAIQIEWENTANRANLTVRNMNRFVFPPWGFRGGEQGLVGKTIVNPGRPDERSIGKILVRQMDRGDVVRPVSPTGGGFGDPWSGISAPSRPRSKAECFRERARSRCMAPSATLMETLTRPRWRRPGESWLRRRRSASSSILRRTPVAGEGSGLPTFAAVTPRSRCRRSSASAVNSS